MRRDALQARRSAVASTTPAAALPGTSAERRAHRYHMHMDHVGGLLADGLKGRLRPDLRVHVAAAEAEFWESPDFSHTSMPAGVPDALRSAATRFLDEYRSQLRTFEAEYEVAPGVVACRTGGHTPGHSVVRLASGGDRLTFAGDAVFQVGFDNPEWYNGFEHDPEEAARVRVRLCRSWRRPASRWWPLTCRSRPSARWRSPATSSVAYRPSGITDLRPLNAASGTEPRWKSIRAGGMRNSERRRHRRGRRVSGSGRSTSPGRRSSGHRTSRRR